MKPLWLKDVPAWNKLSLSEQAERLRKHYCTGPCGQSSDVMQTRSVTDKFFRDVQKRLDKLETEADTYFALMQVRSAYLD
jgi:hypothetical protein